MCFKNGSCVRQTSRDVGTSTETSAKHSGGKSLRDDVGSFGFPCQIGASRIHDKEPLLATA
jgi:hypothetical protein